VESAFRQGLLEAPGTRLIETLLWDGSRFPRLAGHLARLTGSALRLGFACDPVAVQAALHAATGTVPRRVRLTLAPDGALAVETAALPAARVLSRLGPAAERLASGDPWLTVKSTRRAAYDRARAALPPGIDEAVFLNERGEVCDGTITTIFFDRGQGLRTPPLACGLLPGVLRAEMAVPEEVLRSEDLPRVRLWVGNAVRGLIRAEWVGMPG
jgi:4-amino-4-deoxychorismate lyase